ncbi:MAG: DUF2520 domain-containing protein [Flavobacteriales bacterium]|nr:MAG: DUF2520 domain-containing protein [Flavobacteriales bacterium]
MMRYQVTDLLVLGTGNLAWNILSWTQNVDYRVRIWGRNSQERDRLAQEWGTEISETVEDKPGQIVIYALRDDVIAEMSSSLCLKYSAEVHLSGSLPLESLQAAKRGVCWPVASLRKGKALDLSLIPWVVQGDVELPFVSNFKKIESDIERKKLHLSAVFFNNFVYFLGKQMEDFNAQDIDLLDFIKYQTIENLQTSADLQTGPASRGDLVSIEQHRDLLLESENLKAIYELFTQLIAKKYGHEL